MAANEGTMRTLTGHIVAGDTAPQLSIIVLDEPGAGGANHEYEITGSGQLPDSSLESGFPTQFVNCKVSFQNGPIRENGINGVTEASLLAILIDRLRSFQAGPYACDDNAEALVCLLSGLSILQRRTLARIKRGVEGTSQK